MPDENGNPIPGDPRHDVILGRAIPGGMGAVAIGDQPDVAPGDWAVQVGSFAYAEGMQAVALGQGATASAEQALALGCQAWVIFAHAIQLGIGMSPTAEYRAVINTHRLSLRANDSAVATTIVLQSPNMTLWEIAISDAGVLSVTSITDN